MFMLKAGKVPNPKSATRMHMRRRRRRGTQRREHASANLKKRLSTARMVRQRARSGAKRHGMGKKVKELSTQIRPH